MMVSDELKHAIGIAKQRDEREAAPVLIALIEAKIPRIIALERCRELLKELDKYLNFSAGDDKAIILNPEPINEIFNQIAKALEAKG